MRGNIILIGFMGAGKTTVGAGYAKKHGLPLVDTDQEIERLAGMTISEIFERQGETAFREAETAVLNRLLTEEGDMVISVGGGLPMRAENRELLKRLGTVVCLEVSPETVIRRLKGDTTRPLLCGGNAEQKVRELLALRTPAYREAAHLTIGTDGRTAEEIISELEIMAGGEMR